MGTPGRGQDPRRGVAAVTGSEAHTGVACFLSVGGEWRGSCVLEEEIVGERKGSPSQAERKRESSPWGGLVDVVEYD